jgi:hypothetical protein
MCAKCVQTQLFTLILSSILVEAEGLETSSMENYGVAMVNNNTILISIQAHQDYINLH